MRTVTPMRQRPSFWRSWPPMVLWIGCRQWSGRRSSGRPGPRAAPRAEAFPPARRRIRTMTKPGPAAPRPRGAAKRTPAPAEARNGATAPSTNGSETTTMTERLAESGRDFSDHRDVWVYVQQRDGVAAPVGWQLLGQAAQMARDLGVETGAVVVGHNVRHLAEQAIQYGADVVYLVDSPVLEQYRTHSY